MFVSLEEQAVERYGAENIAVGQVPVGRERARCDDGRDGRLGEVDPRDGIW